MSSNEDDGRDYADDGQDYKKRRVQRACDQCRRKKIRCDGVQSNSKPCSNCSAYGYECTYIQTAKRRGPPKSYVESLENRLEKMEKLLRQLCPDADFSHELGDDIGREHWANKPPPPVDPSPLVGSQPDNPLAAKLTTNLIRTAPDTQRIMAEMRTDIEPEDNDYSSLQMTEQMQRFKFEDHDIRFFGRSSGAMLVQAAVDLKGELTSVPSSDFWERGLGSRRPEFWQLHPWEAEIMTKKEYVTYTFPEDSLLYALVDLYFKEINTYLPLLHKPTFIAQLIARRHLADESFAPIVLLVCAVGARFTKDPRVLLEGSTSFHSAGWKWFNQVQIVKRSMFTAPTLHDLQFYMLSVAFLQATSAPQACWTMIGIAVRMAQDVGAHRRRVSKKPLTIEDELWKRAFWVIVFMDRACSGALGRPCATQEEDFDLDYPMDCDDEYWDHPDPEKAWKQPPGRPSEVAFFISMLQLHELLAICLRTIYSINKSKILFGFVGQKWEQQIVAELDSALNKWVDSVPDHLRWDPNREDEVFFNQSVQLYATYYHVQILVHRPFIPSPRKPSPLSFPSLAICANAARSLIHIVDIHLRRTGASHPSMTSAIFTAGIVLLLNIWGGKRSGLSTDPNKEMADVHKAMKCLRSIENGWHTAGRLWDILYELASVGDLALPTPSPQPQKKRERDSELSASATPSRSSPASSEHGPRAIAGSRRVSKDAGLASGHSMSGQFFNLPIHSEELGRLPLHGQVSFFTRPEQQQQHAGPARSDFSNWYGPSAGVSADHAGQGPYAMNEASSFYDQLGHALNGHSLHSAFESGPSAGTGEGPPSVNVMSPGIDTDTMAMWSNAPAGFEMNDWGAYLTNELNHGMPPMS